VYHAQTAETTGNQPPSTPRPPLSTISAAAVSADAAASVRYTAASARLWAGAARPPTHVIAASGLSHKPGSGNAPWGSMSRPVMNRAFRAPKPSQNELLVRGTGETM
jgi:hypothetical protein